MERIRITDIAQELGVSTATVSNVIHGKTKKISDRTVARVQKCLEERQYIPSMAGILLAQNDSRIICVVVNDHEKYEKRVLQDAFVTGSIDHLAEVIEQAGYFMMLKKTHDIHDIIQYASMWNMSGLIMIGFCEQEYEKLRAGIRIPFIIYDGFTGEIERYVNISIDHFSGGYQMGCYLADMGHRDILFLADNDICMDNERFLGLRKAMEEHGIVSNLETRMIIPMKKEERISFYEASLSRFRSYTAIFCASDTYAIELMNFFTDHGMRVPEEISVAGFDDIPECTIVRPRLTTVHQDMRLRAQKTLDTLLAWREGIDPEREIVLPVHVTERESVRKIPV